MSTKSLLIRSIVVRFIVGMVLAGFLLPQGVLAADAAQNTNAPAQLKYEENAEAKFCIEPSFKVVRTIKMIATAYSSSWDETTGIPGKPGLITASGKPVADGVVATNGMPFGTKIRIPELYGEKIFTVYDRMHPRKKGMIDVYQPEGKKKAQELGVKYNVTVEILES